MPGMILFNRRWAIATDDFLWIGIVDTVFYLPWFCWTAATTSDFFSSNCNCSDSIWCWLMAVFLVSSVCLFGLSCVLSVAFIYFSTKGSIAEPEARHQVVTTVQVKIILTIFYTICAIIGSVLLSQEYACVEFDVYYPTKVIVICLWFILSVKLLMVWMFFDPRGKQKKSMKLRKTIPSEHLSPPVPFGSSRKWRYRLQAFCLWFTAPSADRRAAISTVSELLAFLTHDLDLVASDLLAGLRLYRQKFLQGSPNEDEYFQSTSKISLSDGTAVSTFPIPEMPEWMNLKLAQHYFTIGMGVFGWPWTIYRNITCGLCLLCKKCIWCFPCKSQSKIVEGDNCCGCNLAGLQTTSGVEYEDLVHVCFLNRVYQVPFFVNLDHSTSSVVLTVRGSMSCADALTDVSASFEPFDECGCPKESLCHGGLLLAARRIKEKIEDRKILEKAFEGREHYGLILTGHSLGGGVATLLTLMYRGTYRSVRCFAFAPPPVLNEVALQDTMDNVFTIIYGNDVVSYLNYWNVRNMVVEIVDLLKQCHLPKHKVLMGHTEKKVERNEGSTTTVDVGEINKAASTDSVVEGKQTETSINCDTKVDTNGYTAKPEGKTRFYVAGRILNIKHSKKYGYRLRLCDATEFQPLICKRQMIAHHFPSYLEISLAALGKSETIHSDQLNNDSESDPRITVCPDHPTTIEPVSPTTVEPVSPTTVEQVSQTTIDSVSPITVEPVSPTTVDSLPPEITTEQATVDEVEVVVVKSETPSGES